MTEKELKKVKLGSLVPKSWMSLTKEEQERNVYIETIVEKKTLSDKIFYSHTGIDDKTRKYYEKGKGDKLCMLDVKDFISRVKEKTLRIISDEDEADTFIRILIEEAGGRLI